MKPPATSLFSFLRPAFRELFDNALVLSATNFLWFFFSLLLPYWIFMNGHKTLSFIAFFILCPLCSSLHYLHSATIVYPSVPLSIKLFFRTSAVVFLSFYSITLFLFNSAFYGISILTRGWSIMNSFLFFFSLWLAVLSSGLVLFWVPLSLKQQRIKDILEKGTVFYLRNLKIFFFPILSYISLTFLSFLFFFLMAMPLHSLLTFHISDYLLEKGTDTGSIL